MKQVSPIEEMKAYDALPAELRAALSASGEQFSAHQMLNALVTREASVRELVAMIKQEDQLEADAKDWSRGARRARPPGARRWR